MNIEKSINGKEALIKIGGWLDTDAANEVRKELDDIPEDVESLVIDFSELEYIASSGVRQVVYAHKKMSGNLTVKNTPSAVLDIFKATGIDKKIRFE